MKGKSVFVVSLIVIGITILTVYLTGINYNRSLTSNLYLSLGIIATTLFLFMTYGLYKGIGLIDNFPKFRNFKKGDIIGHTAPTFDTPGHHIHRYRNYISDAVFFKMADVLAF
ncbi:hypothetical protein LS482_08815 [Sinomicrobium kalidii]|uniref:hypothetical protein n=1 Tax=Sinomicrobium kalidii TaxID=2900738 RepID=UPI001E3D311E|nr:hypothetical protein [Sinomicrobium kalidii]UGU17969.1 hypothetical protein LS482_08815 [Sinomicrobium kalidii]